VREDSRAGPSIPPSQIGAVWYIATAAHVPGALNLDPAAYDERDLPADMSASLVFYCSNPMCRKAPIAARRAKKMMSAGIAGWVSRNLPTGAAR
jgi:rhodanese-related sulfurtransferase